jgi:MoaA/NifB/PqqE/SkfB family radical SAM enzyme
MYIKKNEILELFNRKHFIDHYIKKQVRNKKRYLPCGAGKKTLTIMPEGDVYFCQFLKSVGNIKYERISDIWSSKKAKNQRRIINKADICRDCYFSCDIYSSIESSFPLTIKMGLIQYLLKWGIINDHE